MTDDEQKHIQELTGSFGVSLEKAEALVRAYPQSVKLQLEVFPYRNKKPKDCAGWIIKAIEKNYPLPPDYEERRRGEEAKVQAEKETRLKNVRSRHEASRGLGQRSILEREKLILTSHGKIRDLQLRIFDKRESRLNRFYEYFKQYPECEVLDFWAWDSRINPNPFEG